MIPETAGNGVPPKPIQSAEVQAAHSANRAALRPGTDLARSESGGIPLPGIALYITSVIRLLTEKGKRDFVLREDTEEKRKGDKPEQCWQNIFILWREKEAENYNKEGKRGRHRTNSGRLKT